MLFRSTNDNVGDIQSFWLDIDCGEGKPYETQGDGADALRGFCRTVGLPKPWVVNSGRGLHVYWPLTEPVSRQDWLPVAKRLKALCVEHNLEADPSRTADAASILRTPDTLNHKVSPALKVKLWMEGATTPFEKFRSAVDRKSTRLNSSH